MRTVKHKANGLTIQYDQKGITISAFWDKVNKRIPWSNIAFCSPTPAPKKEKDTWIQYNGKPYAKAQFLSLQFALLNRHNVSQNAGFLEKICLHRLLLGPLTGADDQPLPEKGVITLDVDLKSLPVPIEVLIEFLAQHTKFDLIVSDW